MRRVVTVLLLLLTMTMAGTLGFRLIEGAPWFDCLYMTVITLTTVGFAEVFPLSPQGRLFVVVFLIMGLGAFTYSALQLGQWIVSIEMGAVWERRRMQKRIAELKQHYIVCGCGRMGLTICEYLHARRKPFVVVESSESVVDKLAENRGWLFVVGDATDDDVLKQAGIERAKSLASVLNTDAANVYVVLSARMLNEKMQIIARASEEMAIQKLERAGATRVISPFSSGAVKMARFMLNPNIEDFFEIADRHEGDLELADVQIAAGSPYIGQKLAETDLRERGVMVVGIRRANGQRLMPPPGSAIIERGDCLFAFGTASAVNDMIGRSGN